MGDREKTCVHHPLCPTGHLTQSVFFFFNGDVYCKEQKGERLRCRKCLPFDHRAARCTNDILCLECSQPGHTREGARSARYPKQTHRWRLPPPLPPPPLWSRLPPPPLPHLPHSCRERCDVRSKSGWRCQCHGIHLPPAKERKRAEANIIHSASPRVTERATVSGNAASRWTCRAKAAG